MSHDNAPLSAGTPVRAVDFPPAQFVGDASTGATLTNITATSYTNGTPEVAIRFMAPTSGRVAVNISAGIRNNTAANQDRCFVSYRILEGDPADGLVIQTEEVKLGVSNYATLDADDDFAYVGHLTMVGGLTPGTFYYCQFRHRTTLGSGTVDINSRQLMVFPIP
jgi:hypothetical protein